ncbi:carbohydrate kinase family protein [Sanguibacter sp. 25GB23B1]|uniref:carbohydrate kinase family protein n=1 Tax=unclassified Sanguibacter TaxID=2645534 RepID=UPI0032AFEBCB
MAVFVNGPASWNTTVGLDALPEPVSATVFADRYADGLGGTSAGKAVSLAALDVDVTLRTLLGNDENGDKVRAALAHPRITLLDEVCRDGRTERHVNLLAADGSRVSVYLELPAMGRGANLPRESHDGLLAADVAVLDLAVHSLQFFARAHTASIPVWCDLHDDDGIQDFQGPFRDGAAVVLVSEARLADPRAYLRDRVERGAQLAVCTRGARGALALDRDGWIEVGTADAGPVVGADGAGDAFFAGLLRGHLDGLDVLAALRLAAATGAISVTSADLGAPQATLAGARTLAETVTVRRTG